MGPGDKGFFIPDDLPSITRLDRNVSRSNSQNSIQKDFLESGSCGNSLLVPADAVNERWVNVINIQTEDRKSIPLTISLTGVLANAGARLAFTQDFNLVIRIEWGVGGVFSSALLDFINGYTFTICCSSLKVSVRNISVTGTPGGDVTVGAFVSKGSSGVKNATRFTVEVASINAGATGPIIPIPDFASSLQYLFNSGSGPVEIQYFKGNGTLVIAEIVAIGQRHEKTDIPRDIVAIRIKNLGLAAIADSRLLFELAI